jgi:RimJ/RimL family protein N-acetyltransferase
VTTTLKKISGRLRRARSQFREELRFGGVSGLLLRAGERAFSPIGQAGLESICTKDLTTPLEEVKARAEIEIGLAGEDDVDQLEQLVASMWPSSYQYGPYAALGHRKTIVSRLQRGQKCFVARVGPDIVHYNWISLDWDEAIAGTGVVAFLAPGQEAVCHDGFTVTAWRGKGIHTAVNNAMLRWLQDAGYRTAYTVVGTLDRRSNITHHRLGWRFSGVFFYLISRRTRRAWVLRVKGTLRPYEKRWTSGR